ncbi:MAG: NPCBM/NEW2 domain-containing protein [Planctomycetes bacterium]|nr:NPCBM/NEW2 domain-containing protein [Planctomycetota bacterium]
MYRNLALLVVFIGLSAGAPRAVAVPVRAVTVEGRAVEGQWGGLDGTGRILLIEQGKLTALAASDLLSLHHGDQGGQDARPPRGGQGGQDARPPRTLPAPASRPASDRSADTVRIYLADGSQFDARITGGDGDSVELQSSLLAGLKLRLSSLAGVWFSGQDVPAAVEAFTQALAHRDLAHDTLFIVQDGKVSLLRGVLEALDERGGSFRWRDRGVPIDRSRAFGVVLATGGGAPPVPQMRCTLTDGSVWAGTIAGGTAGSIRIELTSGPMLNVRPEDVTDIMFRNDRVVFLSDLDPAQYEFTPWATTRWPYHKDRSAANQPLRIDGQAFDRGIGMHASAVLTYSLGEPFKQFAAVIGIDDAVGPRGNVVFRVLADGREVFNSGPVTGRDAARPILVGLNGAQTLQLVVDDGDGVDVGDRADWGAARLIR